jgi:hypothetical protein
MKKLFSVTVLFILSVPVSAQKFNAGIIAGISATQVSGDNLAGFDKAGLGTGGMVSLGISDKISAQFELLYIQKGSKTKSNDSLFYRLNLHYLEVPLLLRYHYRKFIFEAGPSVGVLTGSSEEDLYGEIKGQKGFNTLELSGNVGVNYPFSPHFIFNWRISGSLLPVREHSSGETFRLNQGQYNTVLFFSFRYYFSSLENE